MQVDLPAKFITLNDNPTCLKAKCLGGYKVSAFVSRIIRCRRHSASLQSELLWIAAQRQPDKARTLAAQTSPPSVYCRIAGSATGFRAATMETPGRVCRLASPSPIRGDRCTPGLDRELGPSSRPRAQRATTRQPSENASPIVSTPIEQIVYTKRRSVKGPFSGSAGNAIMADDPFGPAWRGWESYRLFAELVKTDLRYVRRKKND